MELTPENQDIDLPLLQYGIYEVSGTRFLQAFLKPGMTFVDVGANSGYYSLLASLVVGSAGCVVAMEPADGPHSKLLRNIEINALENVRALQAAAGMSTGRGVLYASAVGRNDGLGSLVPGGGRMLEGSDVPMLTLQNVASELPGGRIDLVKIDVEGAELDVLCGGEIPLSSTTPPALLFECFNLPPTLDFLTRLRYDVRHLHFSLAKGLEFPRVGEAFDNPFVGYEAPNFVALKSSDSDGAFRALTACSKHSVPAGLRLLAKFA